MKVITGLLVALALGIGSSAASAQEAPSAPGTVVVTIIPAGATYFTQGKDTKGPSFGNYGVGGALEVRLNPFIGIEGEVAGALGVTQDLEFTSGTTSTKSPSLLNYSGNLVVSVPTGTSVVPYVTGGVGGLTLFDKATLGIADRETFLTGNVGGGLKWFNGRWGLRADYRFITVRSKDDAPAFFGAETRYGHRVYGGLLLNVGR
jgi:opacity protein-like surface antigen